MSLTREEKLNALNYADQGADFMFIPNNELIKFLTNGHPMTNDINQSLLVPLLSGKPIRLHNNLIIGYCNDELEAKNTWLLDHGDIKVVPKRFEIKERKK